MAAKIKKDGEGQYIWQGSVENGQPDRLLGFPTNMSEYAPNTFATGKYVGILGDFKNGYMIADGDAISVQVLKRTLRRKRPDRVSCRLLWRWRTRA